MHELSDQELINRLLNNETIEKNLIDEYYRRCVPFYLEFLGPHWHTGFYEYNQKPVSQVDQIRMIDYVADLGQIKSGDRVLDLGCGIGATCSYLTKRYKCEAFGLTPLFEHHALAQRLAKKERSSFHIDIGYAESIPHENNSFDVVTVFESSCHYSNRPDAFAEAFRVLKPGGRLVGEEWMIKSDQPQDLNSPWIEAINRYWAIPSLGSPNEYQELLKQIGFQKVKMQDLHNKMPLEKGFATTIEDANLLRKEIKTCDQPLNQHVLQGLLFLGKAVKEGVFTISSFFSEKPST